jgi:glutathione S-transferase
MERITFLRIDLWSDPGALLAVTPVGKVPALITDHGAVIKDSTIICGYLDAVGFGRRSSTAIALRVMARSPVRLPTDFRLPEIA